jgi:hypothetical protein
MQAQGTGAYSAAPIYRHMRRRQLAVSLAVFRRVVRGAVGRLHIQAGAGRRLGVRREPPHRDGLIGAVSPGSDREGVLLRICACCSVGNRQGRRLTRRDRRGRGTKCESLCRRLARRCRRWCRRLRIGRPRHQAQRGDQSQRGHAPGSAFHMNYDALAGARSSMTGASMRTGRVNEKASGLRLDRSVLADDPRMTEPIEASRWVKPQVHRNQLTNQPSGLPNPLG